MDPEFQYQVVEAENATDLKAAVEALLNATPAWELYGDLNMTSLVSGLSTLNFYAQALVRRNEGA